MNSKPGRSAPNTATRLWPAAEPGFADRRRALRERTPPAQHRHVDLDLARQHLGREHGRDAAQRLFRVADLGRHRPYRGRGHEPAVRHDRAVPLFADVREVAAVEPRFDRGTSLEDRPGHGSIIAER